MKTAFVGPNGVRAGWRFLLFVGLVLFFGWGVSWLVFGVFHYHEHPVWHPIDFVVDELFGGIGLIAQLLAAATMMRLVERKRWSFSDYGLPLRDAFRSSFWQGSLWGLALPSLLMAILWLAGGVSFHGPALHGAMFFSFLGLWLLGWLGVGLAEEFLFRGYPLFTLSTGIGFWPASLLLSLSFGGLHYFKPMETWIDAVSVTALGLFLCMAVRRTGSLWFAIGFHTMLDFAAMTLYAAPNSGNEGKPVAYHLFDFTFHGANWMTGGPCGIEASIFILPLIAAMFFLFQRLYPKARVAR